MDLGLGIFPPVSIGGIAQRRTRAKMSAIAHLKLLLGRLELGPIKLSAKL